MVPPTSSAFILEHSQKSHAAFLLIAHWPKHNVLTTLGKVTHFTHE